ncbi:MAG: tRNA lysidine(34) synthetase TilS [Phenylobacterium sp.]
MQLARTRAAPPPDLVARIGQVLDRRVLAAHERPIAVALSGGGDSLALLLAVDAWAKAARRRVIVLTVDHRLRTESAGWTDACAATAARLGVEFRALAWEGEKPPAGLPAAARAARHRLLADAAREAGARVILMGHTADDVMEAAVMREAGSSAPAPREWSPSPVWPAGRSLFLLRPMLALRRADIRKWLVAQGEAWIDDPANADLAYARPRARRQLQSGARVPLCAEVALPVGLAAVCRAEADGSLAIARAVLREAASDEARRFVSVACLCVGGGGRPPVRARVERLTAQLLGEGISTRSLAGARIMASASEVRFTREPGEAARGGLASLRLAAGETEVWDGRFEVTADRPVEIRPDRSGRPLAVADDGGAAAVQLTSLTHARLLAACGAIVREPA